MKYHYLFLAPLIIFSIPSKVTLGFSSPIILAIITVGLSSVVLRKQALITLGSMMLLISIIAGKVGTDLVSAPSPDTALLLLQFIAVIFFMEASRVVMSYDTEANTLEARADAASQEITKRLQVWLKSQLNRQFRLAIGALGISLLLLVLGGFASISAGQLAFSSIFVLLVVAALLFLITQRREPETRSSR